MVANKNCCNEKSRRAKAQFLTWGETNAPPPCYLALKGTKNISEIINFTELDYKNVYFIFVL